MIKALAFLFLGSKLRSQRDCLGRMRKNKDYTYPKSKDDVIPDVGGYGL